MVPFAAQVICANENMHENQPHILQISCPVLLQVAKIKSIIKTFQKAYNLSTVIFKFQFRWLYFRIIYDYDIFCKWPYYEMPYHHDNGNMKKDYITGKCNLEVI